MLGSHLMLFDLYSGGHHLQHIQQVLRYWVRHGLEGRVSVVVPASFIEANPWLRAFVAAHPAAGVQLVPVEEPVQVEAPRRFGLLRSNLEHGRVLKRYVERLRPDHVLLHYFDHVQVPLALGLRFRVPAVLGGTYFRPSFYYGELPNEQAGAKERLRRWQKRRLLRAALRNRHFRYLFCLDLYAVQAIRAMGTDAEVVMLPDGIEPPQAQRTPAAVRAAWGVEAGRQVALLFGALSERKGVFAVLDAVQRLPPDLQQRLSLLLAGRSVPGERDAFHAAVDRARQATAVQIILDDRFVPDDDLHDTIRSADLALMPYQRHVGSSGVLVRAAAAAVPVLADDYGVVGRHVRRYGLGLAVDATDARALADALAAWLRDPAGVPFDAADAARFAAENTAEAMAAAWLGAFGYVAKVPSTQKTATS